MSAFGQNGCTILAWCNPDSELLRDATQSDDDRVKKIKELLTDASILWGSRWSIDFTWHAVNETLYIYGICGRLTIGVQTLERALGTLADHVRFHRGGPHDSWEQLVRYRSCLQKWQVPDVVTESTGGEGNQERPSSTFWAGKKTRR